MTKCLCKGKGSIPIQKDSVIQWHNCPDSHCSHDKEKSEKNWQQFKREMREWEQREKEEITA